MTSSARFLVFAFLTAAPMAQTVTNLWAGPGLAQRAMDIVILGDGYTATQLTTFTADAAQLVTRLTTASPGVAPFFDYRFEYRIWSVFAPSAQSGVDLPVAIGGVGPQVRDTRYNCTYNYGGIAQQVLPVNGAAGSNGPVHALSGLTTAIADANMITSIVPQQVAGAPSRIFLVIVNQPNVYGGAAKFTDTGVSYGAAFNGNAPTAPVGTPVSLQVQIHELGHALGLVEDEYHDENPATNLVYAGTPAIAFGFNVTTAFAGPSWAIWVPTIGAPRPGGLGSDTGIWHPQLNCRMNRLYVNGNFIPFAPPTTLGLANPFCSVCIEQVIKRISVSSDPYTGYAPATATPLTVVHGQAQSFSLSHLGPAGTQSFLWRVDGVVVATLPSTVPATPSTLDLNTTPYAASTTLTVDCVALDQNPLIKNPPGGFAASASKAWTVHLVAPTPDLAVVPGTLGSSPTIDAGSTTFPVAGTIVNSGTGAAAQPFGIEYFLCTTPGGPINLSTDVQVLIDSVPMGLPLNAAHATTANGSVPFYTPNGTYYLGAWIDRSGVTADPNLANNTLVDTVPILVTPPLGCPTVLEIAQPLTLVGGGISAAGGGSVTLVNTAPCRVGDTYIVATSVTATAPGTPIGNGFVLPLVQDAATQYALTNINLPPFLTFQGTIGATGQSTATFAPGPGVLGLGGYKIWFATALINPVFGVTGVTNPTGIRINP